MEDVPSGSPALSGTDPEQRVPEGPRHSEKRPDCCILRACQPDPGRRSRSICSFFPVGCSLLSQFFLWQAMLRRAQLLRTLRPGFTPGPASCGEFIGNQIDGARTRVRVQAYHLTSPLILRAIAGADRRGLDVAAILDKRMIRVTIPAAATRQQLTCRRLACRSGSMTHRRSPTTRSSS